MDIPLDDTTRFRIKPLPILLVFATGLGLPYVAAYISQGLSKFLPLPSMHGSLIAWLYSQHMSQMLLALGMIFILRRFLSFDPGLRWPTERAYIQPAILWGVFFGVLMTVVDYAPQLIAQVPPKLGYSLTTNNVVAWLAFEGIYVGPTEEILFRSLLVGYLIVAMPGQLRLGRYTMSWAGVIVAAIFAFAHFASFVTRPSLAAFGQQLYAFALGVLYAYWFEKSKSVVAPIVGHNVSDVTEYAICFVLIALWR